MEHQKARKYIAELFSIVGIDSVLVVMPLGKLKRLYCPFWVICKMEVPLLVKGKEYQEEAVKITLKLEDVFIFRGRLISLNILK